MNVAIIPARGGSKRLPRKNLHLVLGRPMIAWVIDACRACRRIDATYVSTEDAEIAAAARQCGVEVIERPVALADDTTPKQAAVIHAVEWLEARRIRPELVASVQPNSPELTGALLEAGVDKLRQHQLWEVFSVDPQLLQNGAFRIMRRDVVFQRMPSVHCGVVIADCVDVHTAEDVRRVEERLAAAGAPAVTKER